MIIDSAENKRKILQNFLKICEFEGVSEHALSEAMKQSAIDEKFKHIIFENGVIDLIEFYIEEICAEITKMIENETNFDNFKVRDKIKFALYAVFESQKQHKLALQRIRNFYFNITNFKSTNLGARPILLAFKSAGKISDAIWVALKDKSTDFNFYTKRLTLSKIIIGSFGVFLKDESENLEETKKFIDISIEKIMKFEKMKGKMRKFKNDLQEKAYDFLHDEKGEIKNAKQLVKDLPFIRLFK